MKIERISHTDFLIYDYSSFILEDKKSCVKEIIEKIRSRLSLKGFYRVRFSVKKIGIFLQIQKIEDSFYPDTLDLKIEEASFDVYYGTEDYFLIDSFFPVRYFDGKYYCLVDDSFDKILEKVEFGDFIFGEKLEEVLKKSILIQ